VTDLELKSRAPVENAEEQAASDVSSSPSSPVSDLSTEETMIAAKFGWAAIDFKELWRYRELLYFLAWRDLKVKYKQTVMGAAWAVVQPVMTMLVFTFIFGRVAKIDSLGFPYPVFAFCALVPWQYFQASVSQSANSLVGNSALISKIYFPRLTVPIASIIAVMADFLIAFAILVGLAVFYDLYPTVRWLTLPAFFLLASVAALGVGLGLSAINVKFRDVKYITGFVLNFWMWASPVVYPSTLITDETLRLLYYLNPMVGVIDGFRWAVLGADVLLVPGLAISTSVSLVALVVGAFLFKRMERVFADVA
jgi:lipopolysaccharide transport system permease protein